MNEETNNFLVQNIYLSLYGKKLSNCLNFKLLNSEKKMNKIFCELRKRNWVRQDSVKKYIILCTVFRKANKSFLSVNL